MPVRVTVSLEATLYLALAALGLALRLAELDSIPLSDAEAREALAAWRFVQPGAPGSDLLSGSPLSFALNSLLFTLFGASELTARLMTALAGTGLALLPVLWRREMGRVAALASAVLLTFSPTALTAARTMSPAVWSVVLAVVGVWSAWRFYQARQPAYAVAATALAAATALLADPAGFVLLAILIAAWQVAMWLSVDEEPGRHPAPQLRALLGEWPLRLALLTAGAVVLLVSTLFLLYPRGLAQVGELLERGLAGFFSRPDGHPFAFPLLTTLVYEPVLWVFGALGVTYALNAGRLWRRFLVGWVFGGLLAALLYAGAGPAYALWLVMPLAALAGDAVARLLQKVSDPYWTVPEWAVPLLGLSVAALLAVATVNLVWVARPLMAMSQSATVDIQPLRLLLVGMALLLLVILFFLGGSLWGARAAWNGIGLGFVLFLGVYGASSAWGVAVERVDDPRELWHVAPVSRHLGLLRETLAEASYRQTGTPDGMPFVASVPDDGAVAWQLRDYGGLEYVQVVDRRAAEPAIVAPASFQPEALGARYVGQDFVVTRAWALENLSWAEAPIWVLYREANTSPEAGERVVVWLRDDVYGLPPGGEAEAPGEETLP